MKIGGVVDICGYTSFCTDSQEVIKNIKTRYIKNEKITCSGGLTE